MGRGARDLPTPASRQTRRSHTAALRRAETAECGGQRVLARHDGDEQLFPQYLRRGVAPPALGSLVCGLNGMTFPFADAARATHEAAKRSKRAKRAIHTVSVSRACLLVQAVLHARLSMQVRRLILPSVGGRVARAETGHTVLVVDVDHLRALSTVCVALSGAGYVVTRATSFDEARRQLVRVKPDVLITAVRLDGYNGLHLVIRSRE